MHQQTLTTLIVLMSTYGYQHALDEHVCVCMARDYDADR